MLESWISVYQEKCYGSAGSSHASFQVPESGKIEAVKLIHVSGGVSCNLNPKTRWGCDNFLYKRDYFQTFVTDLNKEIIFPSVYTQAPSSIYVVPGGDIETTRELILKPDAPYKVKKGQELQIWYGQDLLKYSDDNNDPNVRHCVKVSMKYC